jgi:hypothetical protein
MDSNQISRALRLTIDFIVCLSADSCKIVKKMRPMINHCRDEYSWTDDDTKSYNVNWQPLSTRNLTEECLAFEKPFDAWRYRDTVELRGTPYAGQIHTYKVSILSMEQVLVLDQTNATQQSRVVHNVDM